MAADGLNIAPKGVDLCAFDIAVLHARDSVLAYVQRLCDPSRAALRSSSFGSFRLAPRVSVLRYRSAGSLGYCDR